jgi:hypothetical protein
MDASPPTLTKREMAQSGGGPFPKQFGLANNPAVDPNTNDGEIDFLVVDSAGNLVIGESGFYDTTAGDMTAPTGEGGLKAEQPKIATLKVSDYFGIDSDTNGNREIQFAGAGINAAASWATSAPLNPGAVSDDTEVLNNPDQGNTITTDGDTADVAYDKGTGYVYFLDRDRDTGEFFEDIYVFDPATGTLVYSELDAVDPGFFNSGSQTIFVRGDLNDDGRVTYADILAMEAAIADPTLGGQYTAAVGQEFYDLTGDNLLSSADLTELVGGILDTAPGDFDLDGDVDGADLTVFKAGFGTTFDGNDFLVWQRNLGFSNMATTAVPEPTAAALSLFALAAVAHCRRRGHGN